MPSESIIDILGQGRDREAQASRIYGLVVGLVTNNVDPEKLGRVKVKFPWLSDEVESWWARVIQPMAGKERGFWWIPEIDDEVMVAFEQGDVRFPYIVGSVHNGKDVPPDVDPQGSSFGGVGYDHGGYSASGRDRNVDGKNDLRFIRSRSGHMFVFDDKAGQEKITLCDKTSKRRLEVFTDKKKIVITCEDGDIELIAGKKILLRCENLITESREHTSMTADATFTAKSKQDMTHKTDANMKREAAQSISEKAGTSTTAQAGTSMTLKAGTTFEASAGASMTVKGAMTTVQASATCTVKGALVMIN